MSDGGWEGLPRVEDLPRLEGGGYDPVAVAAAFDAFYRHAAEVDATLRVLESVDAFQKQAGDLRADLRALRAASWGPLPTARPSYAPAYTVRAERFGGFDLVPRLAIEAAFIIAVALTAAAAGVAAAWVVLLVAGAWLVVGAAEVVASIGRPRLRAPSLPARPTPTPEPVVADAESTPFGWPEAAPAQEPEMAPEPEPAAEPVAADAEAEPEPVAEGPPDADAKPEVGGRRGFLRRRAQAAAEEPFAEPPAPRHVRVLPPAPAAEQEPEPVAEEEAEPAAGAPQPEPEPGPVAEEPVADAREPERQPEPELEPEPEPEPLSVEAESWAAAPAAAGDPWEAPPTLPETTDGPRRSRFRRRRAPAEEAGAAADGRPELREPAPAAEAEQDERPAFPSLSPRPQHPAARSRRGRR